MGLLSTASKTPRVAYDIAQLQSNWWTGAIILAFTLPILLRFIIKNFPRKDTVRIAGIGVRNQEKVNQSLFFKKFR